MTVPSFTQPVPDNGYRWWYLDAVSDDGMHALTVIVFIGSVFSPYYAWARRRGTAPASQHCSVNVVLYGKPSRWCMTERTDASVQADDQSLSIGPSRLSIGENSITVDIDEYSVPFLTRVKGTLNISLPAYDLAAHPLDHELASNARHFWQPVAPQTRISVDLSSPELKWQGDAYVDSNYGDIPLESSFKSWTWSRSHGASGDTTVLYDVQTRDGKAIERSLQFAADGQLQTVRANRVQTLAPTRYFRIPRIARTANDVQIDQLQTLEDAPFYSRSRFIEKKSQNSSHTPGQLQEQLKGQPDSTPDCSSHRVTVHESLDLDRFDSGWVRCLLPFRMPRRVSAVLPD